MLKLGYKASAEQFAPARLLDYAAHAEKAGFESVFVSDHFQPWKHVDGHAPNSLVWLGAAGARTSKVVLGTSVLTPTFRYHPSIVAQAFGVVGASRKLPGYGGSDRPLAREAAEDAAYRVAKVMGGASISSVTAMTQTMSV